MVQCYFLSSSIQRHPIKHNFYGAHSTRIGEVLDWLFEILKYFMCVVLSWIFRRMQRQYFVLIAYTTIWQTVINWMDNIFEYFQEPHGWLRVFRWRNFVILLLINYRNYDFLEDRGRRATFCRTLRKEREIGQPGLLLFI